VCIIWEKLSADLTKNILKRGCFLLSTKGAPSRYWIDLFSLSHLMRIPADVNRGTGNI